jgi:predicted phage tail protein
MIRTIHLHGKLGQDFGEQFRLDVANAPEAVRALSLQLKGFRQAIEAGQFRVVRGDPEQGGMDLGPEEFSFRLGRHDLHIIPVPAGSKGGGGKLILGALMIVAAFIPGVNIAVGLAFEGVAAAATGVEVAAGAFAAGFGFLQSAGTMLVLGGIAQMLAPSPKVNNYQQREAPEQRPSFLFNGAVNTVEQGQPVPVVYGRYRVGSVVVGAGVIAEDIPLTT